MKSIQKFTVYAFGALAVIGFVIMLGAEMETDWKGTLFLGFKLFILGTLCCVFFNDPIRYLRHIYGIVAVCVVAAYRHLKVRSDLSIRLNYLCNKLNGYANMYWFLVDAAYYTNVVMEDYKR